ncbi:hypothetical protein [Methanoculleus sp.]|jgi:hypothetical protein|uniref:hypothetical protein n=1 Tax=Methanoculleus sp. TaxID=90427 RepID=UPI0025E477D2|nr:hypothetical protein [Methanoculleus sp.]MCK9319492.1 hypothetical protein [Methanoculleus sp.]
MNDFDKEALLDVLKGTITHLKLNGNITLPSAQAITWGTADNGVLGATANLSFDIDNSGYVYQVLYQNSAGTHIFINRIVDTGSQLVNVGDVFRISNIVLSID